MCFSFDSKYFYATRQTFHFPLLSVFFLFGYFTSCVSIIAHTVIRVYCHARAAKKYCVSREETPFRTDDPDARESIKRPCDLSNAPTKYVLLRDRTNRTVGNIICAQAVRTPRRNTRRITFSLFLFFFFFQTAYRTVFLTTYILKRTVETML